LISTVATLKAFLERPLLCTKPASYT